jgi:hypothetical protein
MSGSPLPAPTAAERLRTLVRGELSLDVVAAQRRVQLLGRHEVDGDGDLRLSLPRDSALGLEVASDGRLPARLEVTDVAAVAMRNRIRARAVLTGMLQVTDRSRVDAAPDLDAVLRLATAELTDGEATARVDPAEFRAARPDPLAAHEARLLCHLVDTHADLVGWLARLVPPDRLHGVRRILPLRLDRYGIVLRLEFARLDRDVRLPFSAPVDAPEDAPTRMLELLARSRGCHRRSTVDSQPPE